MPAWIIAAQWASRLILVLLIVLSVWSISIIIDRLRALPAAHSDNLDELKRLLAARDWPGLAQAARGKAGLEAGALAAAMEIPGADPELVERAVKSYLAREKTRLEAGFTALATLGSNAPFIGLFGTVLGIIQAFGALSSSNAGTNSVMSGISEALVATAVGLFVAIPAVIAYNVFSRRLKVLLSECEALRDSYIAFSGAAGGSANARGGKA